METATSFAIGFRGIMVDLSLNEFDSDKQANVDKITINMDGYSAEVILGCGKYKHKTHHEYENSGTGYW